LKLIVLAGMVSFFITGCGSGVPTAVPNTNPNTNTNTNTVVGNWRLIKSIVGGAQVAPLTFTENGAEISGSYQGLQDGDSAFEDWTIVAENNQYKLTSPYGSCYGQAGANNSTVFTWEGQDPRVSAYGVENILKITIYCYLSSNGEMVGTITNDLYTSNGLWMSEVPSTESWVFRATRK